MQAPFIDTFPSHFAVRTRSACFVFDAATLQHVSGVPAAGVAQPGSSARHAVDTAAQGPLLAFPCAHVDPGQASVAPLSLRQVAKDTATGAYSLWHAAAAGAEALAPFVAAVSAPQSQHALQVDATASKAFTADAPAVSIGGGANRAAASPAPASGSVTVVNLDTEECLVRFQAHSEPIVAVAISPCRRLLATADAHGQTVAVWQLPKTATSAPPRQLYACERGITHAHIAHLAFSEDSTLLLVASAHGTLHAFAVDPTGGGPPKPPVRVTAASGRTRAPLHPQWHLHADFEVVVVPEYIMALEPPPEPATPTTLTPCARLRLATSAQRGPPAALLEAGRGPAGATPLVDARRASSGSAIRSAPQTPWLASACLSHGSKVTRSADSSAWQALAQLWAMAALHGTPSMGAAEDADEPPPAPALGCVALTSRHTVLAARGGGADLPSDTTLFSAWQVGVSVTLAARAALILAAQVSGAAQPPFAAEPASPPAQAAAASGGQAPALVSTPPSPASQAEAVPPPSLPSWSLHAARQHGADTGHGAPLPALPQALQARLKGAWHSVDALLQHAAQWARDAGSAGVRAVQGSSHEAGGVVGGGLGASWAGGGMEQELAVRQGRWGVDDVRVTAEVSPRGTWWLLPRLPRPVDAVGVPVLPTPAPRSVDSGPCPWKWYGEEAWHAGAFGDTRCDPAFSTGTPSSVALARRPPLSMHPPTRGALVPGREADSSLSGLPDPTAGKPAAPAAVLWGAAGLVLDCLILPTPADCEGLAQTPLEVPEDGGTEGQNLAELWTLSIGADPRAIVAMAVPTAPPLPQPHTLRPGKAGDTWDTSLLVHGIPEKEAGTSSQQAIASSAPPMGRALQEAYFKPPPPMP